MPSERRVLVVDDRRTNRLFVSAVLSESSIAHDVASDAVNAIGHLSTGAYGVVILGCRGTDMGGEIVLDYIRSADPGPKVLAMTAASDADKLKSLGADHVLEEPFLPADLLSKI